MLFGSRRTPKLSSSGGQTLVWKEDSLQGDMRGGKERRGQENTRAGCLSLSTSHRISEASHDSAPGSKRLMMVRPGSRRFELVDYGDMLLLKANLRASIWRREVGRNNRFSGHATPPQLHKATEQNMQVRFRLSPVQQISGSMSILFHCSDERSHCIVHGKAV
jgi:hypothetical protein